MKLEAHSPTKGRVQKKDHVLITTSGTMDRGAFDFHTRISEHEGDIMSVATKEVITAPPTTRIIDAIKIMTRKNFRHIPLTDAGTNRVEGIVTSFDVIDFLGGGDKNQLVEKRYKGNLLAAINADVSTIMQHNVISIRSDGNIREAFDLMLKNNIGSLPIVDNANHVHAICTEKDFLTFTAGIVTNKTIAEYMSKRIEKASADMTISDAAKIMVMNRFRRLPVVKGDILIGVVNASSIMHFLGNGDAFEKLTTGNIHEAMDAPISSLISKDVVWVSSDADLGKASELMVKNGVGALPVIDNGKLCGIITERDILRAMAE
ncbi:CBS domain-containing protein [Methanococcoides vulcani]|uniref:CBS domain-containing protein n=1 Tax=Methanococcoides vulcani TaxID=1353158 RepID=A0A1I0AUW5_9EURY|nr:CBS domain-containing protein [Methanococcoides vulcani]SES98210.1 CBS domain-containing protein [Methanococcoides vulcani]